MVSCLSHFWLLILVQHVFLNVRKRKCDFYYFFTDFFRTLIFCGIPETVKFSIPVGNETELREGR